MPVALAARDTRTSTNLKAATSIKRMPMAEAALPERNGLTNVATYHHVSSVCATPELPLTR
jgi:hypothetical protein